jgi:hypothetical protein
MGHRAVSSSVRPRFITILIDMTFFLRPCRNVSFMPLSGKGFSLDYPSIALHAISRTLPSSFGQSASSSSPSLGCLYCQLEGAEEEEYEEDTEEQSSLSELWILPAEQESCELALIFLICLEKLAHLSRS